MNKWLGPALVMALCAPLVGCGAELERSSEIETLRVLGVQKSKSYAQAGDQVSFSMLWHDAEGRDITPVWFVATEAELNLAAALVEGGNGPTDNRPWDNTDELMPLCANPERDTYYECLGQLAAILSNPEARELVQKTGDSITLNVPRKTVIVKGQDEEGHEIKARIPTLKKCSEIDDRYECDSIYHPPPDQNLPDFGSMFALFALCPGELGYQNVKEGFGLTCTDDAGEVLGPDDFVFGYSQIFLYEDFQNANPVVDGMSVDGEKATACIGLECLDDDAPRPEECGDGVPCLDVCTKADEDDCPEIDIKPSIPKTYACDAGECENAEDDQVAQIAYGRDYKEQMWIRYYTDQGRMKSEVRLLNDATTGWNSDYGTKLRLPKEKGPLRLWAVVYDNRGGQDWVRVDAVVR